MMEQSEDIDLFLIETLLIESNHMSVLEESISSLKDVFQLDELVLDEIKRSLYFMYYSGRLDSSGYFINGLSRYIKNNVDNITDDHREIISEFILLSENQHN